MKKCILGNEHNKSEIIRQVYAVNPAATNREIKMVIKEQYGFDVGSNLIIQSLGSEKRRTRLGIRTAVIVAKCKDLIQECGNDVGYAMRCLRMAI